MPTADADRAEETGHMAATRETTTRLIPPRLLDVGMRLAVEGGPRTVTMVLGGGLFLVHTNETYDLHRHPVVPVVPYDDGGLLP